MLVDISENFMIPANVAVCPSCGSELMLDPTEWGEDREGRLIVYDFNLDCLAKPDPGNKRELGAWYASHRLADQMPYVYWLPLHLKVEAFLKTIDFVDVAAERRKLARWNQWAGACTARC